MESIYTPTVLEQPPPNDGSVGGFGRMRREKSSKNQEQEIAQEICECQGGLHSSRTRIASGLASLSPPMRHAHRRPPKRFTNVLSVHRDRPPTTNQLYCIRSVCAYAFLPHMNFVFVVDCNKRGCRATSLGEPDLVFITFLPWTRSLPASTPTSPLLPIFGHQHPPLQAGRGLCANAE